MIRIEATYLVDKLPAGLEKNKRSEIDQGYIVDGGDASRIRKKDNSYSITRKLTAIQGDNSIKEHIELPISKEEFEKIWKLVIRSLEKKRYYLDSNFGPEIRVDVFEGDLKGLVLAEVIFASEEERKAFAVPSWFGKEVTAEEWASNSYLAGKKLEQIKLLLQ